MAFMRSVAPLQREMTASEFKAWLRQFDKDRDGSLSREELQNALRSLHAWFAWWKARQGLKEADVNKNRKVDQDEMNRLINYAQQHLNMKIYVYDSS